MVVMLVGVSTMRSRILESMLAHAACSSLHHQVLGLLKDMNPGTVLHVPRRTSGLKLLKTGWKRNYMAVQQGCFCVH